MLEERIEVARSEDWSLVLVPARGATAGDLVLAARQAAIDPSSPPELRALGALLDRVSPSSAKEYARDVRSFALWCQEQGLSLFQADRPVIERWKRACHDQQIKPRTVRRRLAAVQGFYLEAHDLGLVGAVPTVRVKRP